MTSIHEAFGRVGLPAPVEELAGRTWDVVVVGGGHNGLTCAAYLAQAGKSVLVLERRERLGGACTLEEPFTRLRRQPVRLRRRPARPAGHRRAGTAPPRLQGVPRRAGDLVPVRRRHLVRPVPGPRPHRRRDARERLLRGRHQGPVRVRGLLRPHAQVVARRGEGHVGRRRSRRRRAARPARRRPRARRGTVRDVDRRRHRPLRHRSIGCSRRCTARASSGRGPGRARRARRRSS